MVPVLIVAPSPAPGVIPPALVLYYRKRFSGILAARVFWIAVQIDFRGRTGARTA
jgi:hypothetical protein